MSTSTNTTHFDELTQALSCALQKPSRPKSATIVETISGRTYRGGSISSDSSLFDITAEHVALIRAIQHHDYHVTSVTTLTEESTISPIAIKILKDFSARVHATFSYTVLHKDGSTLFSTPDIQTTIPEYVSPSTELSYIQNTSFTEHCTASSTSPSVEKLRSLATLGMEHHFLSEENGSRYGCAIATKSGALYACGAYGSPDKRLGLHAEMATIASAIADGARDITHIAIIATKYPDAPCPVCGHCRQVLVELLGKIGGNPQIISLASESDAYEIYSLEELLPHQWKSKKW